MLSVLSDKWRTKPADRQAQIETHRQIIGRPETISYREVEEVENSRSGLLLVIFPQCYTTDKPWWLVSYGCVALSGGLCESVPLYCQSLVSADVHIQTYWPLCFQVILLCLPSCSRSTGIMVVSTRCHCAQLSMVPGFEFRQSGLHSHAVLQLSHLWHCLS